MNKIDPEESHIYKRGDDDKKTPGKTNACTIVPAFSYFRFTELIIHAKLMRTF